MELILSVVNFYSSPRKHVFNYIFKADVNSHKIVIIEVSDLLFVMLFRHIVHQSCQGSQQITVNVCQRVGRPICHLLISLGLGALCFHRKALLQPHYNIGTIHQISPRVESQFQVSISFVDYSSGCQERCMCMTLSALTVVKVSVQKVCTTVSVSFWT